MKLLSFSVSNYRSITRAHKIELHDLTILVGKNNEGKSNIIKALSLSMNIIRRFSSSYFPSSKFIRHDKFSEIELEYIWDRDFPVSSQNKISGSKKSKFILEFELSDDELRLFNKYTSSKMTTYDFIICIEIGVENKPNIKILKKGTSKLNSKVQKVNSFVVDNLSFNYIPAIRTELQAVNLIYDTIADELKALESDSDYVAALKTISNLQKKPLSNIAKKVEKTLKDFIPSVSEVKIDIEDDFRRLLLRKAVNVSIDDGVLTNIEYKGDGIKSLVTLAMLTDRYNTSKSSIIAIDEPEAHLHPGSIRQLNHVLRGLVNDNQVIISTHNQLFINKENIKSNIIVSSGKATPAKNIKEIRDILGVKLSDNLVSCSNVLFVEGKTDEMIIRALCLNNPILKKAMNSLDFSIVSLGGASNLSSEIFMCQNAMLDYYALLDNDDAGKDAFKKALGAQLIDVSHITFINCKGKASSELEDLIDPSVYIDAINDYCNSNLNVSCFNSMSKWSDQLKDALLNEGKYFTEDIEKEIKIVVANCCCDLISRNENVFLTYRRQPIDSLVMNLEKMVSKQIN